jgi:hypothetical protein
MVKSYAPDGECPLCKKAKERLDVHHLAYKKLYDVHSRDLVVACRDCHDRIHEILNALPEIKKHQPRTQKNILRAIMFDTEEEIEADIYGLLESGKSCVWEEITPVGQKFRHADGANLTLFRNLCSSRRLALKYWRQYFGVDMASH